VGRHILQFINKYTLNFKLYMENKTLVTILIVVLVLLVGFGAWYVMNYPNPITDYMNNNTTENNNQNDNNQNQAKGTLLPLLTPPQICKMLLQ